LFARMLADSPFSHYGHDWDHRGSAPAIRYGAVT